MSDVMRTIRFSSEAQLKEIDRRAQRMGLSRNAYILRACLGELDDPSTVDERLDELEERIGRLEHYQQLGG